MKRVLRIVLLVLIWLAVGAASFRTAYLYAQNKQSKDIYSNLHLFNQVLEKLKANYVDDLDNEELINNAIEGMFKDLDPHTTFFSEDEFEDFTTGTKGEFGGLGIRIDKKGDYITVVSPMEGTPAYKMGIMAGDKIIKVDGESVVAVSTDDAIKKMRGDKGTKVVLTISRPGVKDPLDFEIIRDIIKIQSVPYAFKTNSGVGYIKVNQFNANTTEEFRAGLDGLEKAGINGLIIDLRYNPGGLLSEAVNMVNEFIGKDKLVVFTKGRAEGTTTEYKTRYNRQREGYPVVVLINEASASAAEIFAGTMQDYDKALVLGKPSFGKGSVQQLFPLSMGKGIKITVSHYYIPSGRCIHKKINDKILRGKEVSEEEKKEAKIETDNEIYKTLVKQREVHGGGGINPDVELEREPITNFEIELRRNNMFFNYAIDYSLNNGNKITKDYKVDEKTFQDFLSKVTEKGIKYTPADVDSAKTFIEVSLESDILSKNFGTEIAYQHNLELDKQYQEAVKILENHHTLDDLFDYALSRKKEVSNDGKQN
ncbi:MAG: S41 family peptidase [Candidatus Cloacimonetes bacterium]|nr:S41 family peptidase [Candidatus Cloacimonadota bacterium]